MNTYLLTCLVCEYECETEIEAETLSEAQQLFVEAQECPDLTDPGDVQWLD